MAKFDLKSLLSEKSLSQEETKKAQEQQKNFKVVYISVYDLIPSEDNFYSVKDIKELKEAVELFGGIKQNLIVKAMEEGKYKVIAGHKRRLASLALVEEGKATFEYVPCIVEETGSIEERLLLIMTNSTTRQLSDYEKTRQAEELKGLLLEYKKQEKIPGRIRDLVAEILGTSPTQIGRMEAISKNLSEDFKEAWKENKVNTSTAYEISSLPQEKQIEAYDQYKETGSITINQVKEMKKVEEQTDEETPLQGQVGFYEEEAKKEHLQQELEEIQSQEVEQNQSKELKSTSCAESCGFCKADCHVGIMTEEGNYLIDIDSKNKRVHVVRRGDEIETLTFVFCPMCGRKL